MDNAQTYVLKSFVWSTIAKILDAGVKFATIPLLINYLGKDNYGLLALALSTNAFMQILNMGMNTGIVKFFSQWISAEKYDLVDKVSRTNLTFYTLIGIINGVALVILAFAGNGLFNIANNQQGTFSYMLIILAIFGIVNWVILALQQLLIADERIGFTEQMLSIRSVLGLIVVFFTIIFKWSILDYFTISLLANSIIIIPYSYACLKSGLITSLIPAFYWKEFAVVFKYSLAIFMMSVFQTISTQSRPLILGAFSNQGVGVVTEYRIIEVFPMFVISIGGILTTILLPKTAKAIQDNNRASIEKIAYQGTRITSILTSMLCFPLILVSSEILFLYVGNAYSHLSVWLALWLCTLLLFLHNTPVASLVLATGKTRMLVYSSALAATVSVIINILLCNIYGAGSAVLGYMIYIIIQMSFYYFYFNNKVLGLRPQKVFKSFAVPTIYGAICYLIVWILDIHLNLIIFQIILKILLWDCLFILSLYLTKVYDFKQLFILFFTSK
ncbi:lipopolysaccharide biosynthesis protein [Parabacteroides sp. Marseille-P3160]|uniref:lipopolysaccharide biosynthesis protein n=1 Tax=Parabacteroides sp. Marseille-P3160 TaxID=1917887 RepID=UPI0009B9EC5C|nr:oligosaccharide flippase family protein [Parabacteroides sp. Marseille-P3160]